MKDMMILVRGAVSQRNFTLPQKTDLFVNQGSPCMRKAPNPTLWRFPKVDSSFSDTARGELGKPDSSFSWYLCDMNKLVASTDGKGGFLGFRRCPQLLTARHETLTPSIQRR